MITPYEEEMKRIHALDWDKHQQELERYASDLWIAIQHRDRVIERLKISRENALSRLRSRD